jgi:pseudouridine synthase
MRIQKYLSQQRILSRREAEAYIKKGLIKLNGKIVSEMGVQIDPVKDKIEVLKPKGGTSKRTLVFYKPRGMTTEEIVHFKPEFADLNPVGRLDKESEGLILLSNDGVVTAAVTSDKHLVEKEYQVNVQENIPSGKIRKMEEGVRLEDGMTMPAQAELVSPHVFRLTIKEGRKHQIRRMADALHLTVTQLKRIRIGPVTMRGMKATEFRSISPAERRKLIF